MALGNPTLIAQFVRLRLCLGIVKDPRMLINSNNGHASLMLNKMSNISLYYGSRGGKRERGGVSMGRDQGRPQLSFLRCHLVNDCFGLFKTGSPIGLGLAELRQGL